MEGGPQHKRFKAEEPAPSSIHPLIDGSGCPGAISGYAKACLKFFSTCGCPYGEGCHFSHYVPGGFATPGLGPGKSGCSGLSLPASDARLKPGGFKTQVCNQFGTRDGCRFGDKCHFAHGEKELRKVNGSSRESTDLVSSSNLALAPSFNETSRAFLESKDITSTNSIPTLGRLPREPSPPGISTSLGASSVAQGSISSRMVPSTVNKVGNHVIELMHLPGAILDHEKYANLRSIAMERSFDQVKTGNQMVKALSMRKDPLPPKSTGFSSHKYKTKLCENFARGTCTFGERCHFAHGEAELRKASFPT